MIEVEYGDDGAFAQFDADRRYRYALGRKITPDDEGLEGEGLTMLFVMLNPSTADAFKVDPTVRRCMGFAGREGCERLRVVNLFALRSTDPTALYREPEPVGPLNDQIIAEQAAQADVVVAAWGKHGAHLNRGLIVAGMLRDNGHDLRALKIVGGGHPGHPLYIPADAPLVRYTR